MIKFCIIYNKKNNKIKIKDLIFHFNHLESIFFINNNNYI